MRPCPQYQPSLGSNPPAWSIFKGWGTPQRHRLEKGMSLGWGQWPSCLTTPATSLSCPHSPSRRSPWPSRRVRAGSSGQTSRFWERRQSPKARRSARPPSAWRRRFRRAGKPLTPWRGAAFYLANRLSRISIQEWTRCTRSRCCANLRTSSWRG